MTPVLTHPWHEDLECLSRVAAPGLWEPLRGQAVFVTGGTGFFGRWLLASFAHASRTHGLAARALVLTRDLAKFRRDEPWLANDPAIVPVVGDVRTVTAEQVRAQLPPETAGSSRVCTFFIHAAASSDARDYARDPLGALDTVLLGTRNALDLARTLGVRRFLFASSGAVYGPQPPHVSHVQESFRAGGPDYTQAADAYGEGKRAAETYCACAAAVPSGPEVVTARAFAFVGPGLPLDQHFAIGNFLKDALAGRPIEIKGDGTPHRSYLYAADLALWLWTILLRGAAGRAYNVGSDRDLPLGEVAAMVARGANESNPVPVRIAQTPVPGALPTRYVPDVTRAKTELGLRETVSLEEAIRRTLAWHRRL